MNDKIENKKGDLDVLERYLGFLGVMIALVLTIAWDFISSSKFETISREDKIWSFVYYCVCLIALGIICFFYYELYFGNTRSAQIIGSFLFVWFVVIIFLGITPIRAYALPFLKEVIVGVVLFMGFVLGSFVVGFFFGKYEIMSKLKDFILKHR